jgi:proline utilization trans-activator
MINQVKLPPYHFAKHLFTAQYSYIGTIFAFVDLESFQIQLQEACNGAPVMSDQDSCLAYSKVLVILAFGQMYSVNQWNGHDGPPGFGYFTQALQFLPDIHEESSILFVETLALIGYYLQNLNRRDAAFLYVGIALRMAISLALHQEVPSSHLDDIERERRRRVWWSVYSLDRILCIKSGNPITIEDKDIGVALPARLPSEPEYCPAVVLRHYTVLSTILGRIGNSIYRKVPKSGSSIIASVHDIMTSLSQWHRDIPDELRFDPAKLDVSRESVSTFLHYYQCINMTVRQLLVHLVQQRLNDKSIRQSDDWRHGLTPPTVTAIENCIAAARGTIDMMTVAAQKDLVGT